jgi:protein SCO1
MKTLLDPQRRRCVAWLSVGGSVALLAPGWARAHGGSHEREREPQGLTVKPVALGKMPAVSVVSMRGHAGKVDDFLKGNDPLLVNFVFTTCSTTCSMQTAVLAELQRQFIARRAPLRLVSITIDPANDTPEQLQRFAKTFGVQEPAWQFLTGQFDDLVSIQRHFDVYRGSKISHPPVVMIRASEKAAWVRVEGMPTAGDLTSMLRKAGSSSL